MNGITYYRLKSDYTGDYTKNCALNGSEVDNNFYVLEGRDIKSIAVSGKDIIVTLMNGDTLSSVGVLDFAKPEDIGTYVVSAEFDKVNGVLKLTSSDGTIQNLDGFSSNENTNFSVSTDNTLCGTGLRHAPLGVASSAKTGQYKPVKAIVNIAEGGKLPIMGNIFGDRYVTCEDVSDYGYLYDYSAVRDIACELKRKGNGWRIPTKKDWDDLLNAVEPCDRDKTHEKADKNKFLGKWAGKLLKSKTMWRRGCNSCDCGCSDCSDCDHEDNTCIDYDKNLCTSTNDSETECKCKKDNKEHDGIDAYGFRVTPSGYADDGCNFEYFKERAAFWTASTNEDHTKAYIKRFQHNKDGVYQDVIPSNYHLSLRLVKDYDGKNYSDVEEIMDMEYPILLLPSVSKGKSIWTSANIACGDCSLNPMLPNNGQGQTYTRHFFINEWNGFKWVRNEVKQGETVTVAKDVNGKEMVEYRVIGTSLVSVNEMIYNDVMADIQPILDNINEELESSNEELNASVTELQEALTTEAEERKSADEALQEALTAETEERKSADETLQSSISTVNDNLVTAIDNINNNITTIVGEISESMQNETNARISADEALQEALTAETDERKSADEEIEGKLLTGKGTTFNAETGILTLKSEAGTNDIKIAFAFNFGEF